MAIDGGDGVNHYSALKFFHFPDKLRDWLAGRVTPPIHVRLKPTNRCNHDCAYCCYRNPDLPMSELFREHDEIPWTRMQALLDELADAGVRSVTFSGGGDPLCYPRIADAVERLAGHGVRVALLTNGSALVGEIADVLGRRATWVRVSMDADEPATYAKIRRIGLGVFDHVCKNLERFARTKSASCELGINFVATRENAGELYGFLARMKRIGVAHVKVSEAVVSRDDGANAAYLDEFVRALRNQVDRAKRELGGDGFAIVDHIGTHGRGPATHTAQSACPMIHWLVAIGADLNVYTCQDKAYTTSGLIGSVRDRSFVDLWRDADTHRRILSHNPGVACRHHCAQEAKIATLVEFRGAGLAHTEFV